MFMLMYCSLPRGEKMKRGSNNEEVVRERRARERKWHERERERERLKTEREEKRKNKESMRDEGRVGRIL